MVGSGDGAFSVRLRETVRARDPGAQCNHFCGCLNRQATGDIRRVSPVLCAHERTILPIVDRLAERLYKKRSALFVQKHYNEYYPLISLAEDSSG